MNRNVESVIFRGFRSLEGVSDDSLMVMRSELMAEIARTGLAKELEQLAAKRNGLQAVENEMKLRGIYG